jgi:hypothetical protein
VWRPSQTLPFRKCPAIFWQCTDKCIETYGLKSIGGCRAFLTPHGNPVPLTGNEASETRAGLRWLRVPGKGRRSARHPMSTLTPVSLPLLCNSAGGIHSVLSSHWALPLCSFCFVSSPLFSYSGHLFPRNSLIFWAVTLLLLTVHSHHASIFISVFLPSFQWDLGEKRGQSSVCPELCWTLRYLFYT